MRHGPQARRCETGHRNGGRRPPVSGQSMGARPVRSNPEAKPHRAESTAGQPVEAEGAADRWTAPKPSIDLKKGRPRGLPFFAFTGHK